MFVFLLCFCFCLGVHAKVASPIYTSPHVKTRDIVQPILSSTVLEQPILNRRLIEQPVLKQNFIEQPGKQITKYIYFNNENIKQHITYIDKKSKKKFLSKYTETMQIHKSEC
jgi:hypothetical protein